MDDNIFRGKKVVLGVSGGIAAYKAVDLASKLTQAGARVTTIMTANATKFVGPITFQAVTGQAVVTDLFESDNILVEGSSGGDANDGGSGSGTAGGASGSRTSISHIS